MAGSQIIVGSSPAVKELLQLIDMFADSAATVLVSGESGTGKELVAQALHGCSSRRKAAFVPVNCAAIPRDLLESELFGHRKGAFSGAIADRVGRFELAEGGTLFLDEVGDMPLELQAKILRVLQEGVVDPVGSTRQVKVDVRVVAATHRDLETECAAGRFREDLYYRLNVLPIVVPPLRDRVDDLGDLIAHLASKVSPRGSIPFSVDPEFLDLLKSYSWPGNIRELSNLVHRLSVMFSGKLVNWRDVPRQMFPKKLLELLPESSARVPTRAIEPRSNRDSDEPVLADVDSDLEVVSLIADADREGHNPLEEIILIANGKRDFPIDGVPLKMHLSNFERKLISHALNHTGGNISKTAQLLNLQRTTLVQKLNKLKGRGSVLENEVIRSMSSVAVLQ